MAYPGKFNRLERIHGKPIAEILVDRLNELGTVERVAADIQISYTHVIKKVNELGLIKDVRWRLPEAQRD